MGGIILGGLLLLFFIFQFGLIFWRIVTGYYAAEVNEDIRRIDLLLAREERYHSTSNPVPPKGRKVRHLTVVEPEPEEGPALFDIDAPDDGDIIL